MLSSNYILKYNREYYITLNIYTVEYKIKINIFRHQSFYRTHLLIHLF